MVLSREGAWYILLSTLVGMAVAFYTVVQTTSGTGAAHGVTEMGHLQVPSTIISMPYYWYRIARFDSTTDELVS